MLNQDYSMLRALAIGHSEYRSGGGQTGKMLTHPNGQTAVKAPSSYYSPRATEVER